MFSLERILMSSFNNFGEKISLLCAHDKGTDEEHEHGKGCGDSLHFTWKLLNGPVMNLDHLKPKTNINKIFSPINLEKLLTCSCGVKDCKLSSDIYCWRD